MSSHHIEVVTVDEELVRESIRAAGVPFSFEVEDDELDRIVESFDLDRFVAPLDGATVIGSGGSFLYEVTVPGGAKLPASGITFITVLPTHRRRGVLRRMMRKLMDDAREREEPLATLWASEATIYGRFGYGQAVEHVTLKLDTRRAQFRGERPQGTVRLVSHENALDVVASIHAAACERHGMLGRSEHLWKTYELRDETWMRRGYGARRIVVWSNDRGPQGYGFFRTKLGEESSARVDEFHALTPEAYRGLAKFFADIDLIDSVIFRQRPPDEPLQWMLQDNRALKPTGSEFMWWRLLDVPRALQARTYAATGSLAIEVHDHFHEENDRTWRVTVEEGQAECVETTEAADITLDVSELGALYMGGRSALPLAAAGRIDGSHKAVALLDRLFRTQRPPWSGEDF